MLEIFISFKYESWDESRHISWSVECCQRVRPISSDGENCRWRNRRNAQPSEKRKSNKPNLPRLSIAWIKKMNINHNIIICKTILTRNSPVHQPKNRCCSFSTAFQWRQHEIQSCHSWIFYTFLSVSGDPSPWKVPPQLNSVNRNILTLISRFITTKELVFNLYHLTNH